MFGRSVRVIPRVPPPLEVGAKWMFLGDSQTDGRATGTTKSHAEAFCRIWETKFPATGPVNPYTVGLSTDPYKNGVSGRRLGGDGTNTRGHYDGRAERLDRTWVHLQESGSQGDATGGQDTAPNFKATYKSFIQAIHANTPNARKSYETAFSFGREGEAGRNWDDWNTAMKAANNELHAAGIDVVCVETDFYIKALQTALTPADVWFQAGDANEYHYKALGNLMVAMALFKALRITVTRLDMVDIAEVTEAHKQAALTALEQNP